MSLLVAGFFLGMAWFVAEHFPPWISWHNEFWAFAAVLWAAGTLLIRRKGRRPDIKLPLASWPFLLLVVVAWIQVATGRMAFAGDAWILTFYLMLCVLAMVVGYSLHGTEPRGSDTPGRDDAFVCKFAVLVLASGLACVAIAAAQSLELWTNAGWVHRMPGPRRPGANIGQTNQLATLLLLALVSLAFLFETSRVRRLLATAMAAILLFGLALTESRTGVLSVLLVGAWWFGKRRVLQFRIHPAAVALAFVFLGLCLFLWPGWLSLIRIESGGATAAASVNLGAGTRIHVWPQLLEAIFLKPWLGWGIGAVPEALNAVLHRHAISENFTYAHNVVLDLAIGIGLPLTVLLLICATSWLWRRMRDVRDPVSWYCVAFVLPFAVHSMFEFPFAYAYLLAPVMLMVGVLEAHVAPSRSVAIKWAPAASVWALTGAAMAWSVVEYLAVEEDFRVARFEVLNVGRTPADYERPDVLLLTQMHALLEGARLNPRPGMDDRQIEFSRNVAMRFPGPATQNRYAVALALNGQAEESMRQLKVMRLLYGEKSYASSKLRWQRIAEEYPQLRAFHLP